MIWRTAHHPFKSKVILGCVSALRQRGCVNIHGQNHPKSFFSWMVDMQIFTSPRYGEVHRQICLSYFRWADLPSPLLSLYSLTFINYPAGLIPNFLNHFFKTKFSWPNFSLNFIYVLEKERKKLFNLCFYLPLLPPFFLSTSSLKLFLIQTLFLPKNVGAIIRTLSRCWVVSRMWDFSSIKHY